MENTKTCTKCNTTKDISEFQIRTDTGKHRLQCIKCRLESSKKHYERNKHKRLEQCKEYYENNKEAKREWGFKYREENKIHRLARGRKYYQNNKDAINKRIKKYRETPIGKAVAKNASGRRRSRLRSGTISNLDIKNLREKTKNCYWCNVKLKKDYHLDHYLPLSKGGKHVIENIVITCPTCNLRKNAKDPLEFANQLGRLL